MLQPRHGVRGGADAGQNDVRRRSYDGGIRGHGRVGAEPLQGELQRGGIRASARHNDDSPLVHRLPLVLGSSEPSIRIAWRRLRPTPLKQDSIM